MLFVFDLRLGDCIENFDSKITVAATDLFRTYGVFSVDTMVKPWFPEFPRAILSHCHPPLSVRPQATLSL